MTVTKKYKVENMDCESCAMLIECDLEDQGFKAKCSYKKQNLEVELKTEKDHEKIVKIVKNTGYDIKPI